MLNTLFTLLLKKTYIMSYKKLKKYQPSTKNKFPSLNVKLLHTKAVLFKYIYPHCESRFFNSKMQFYLRKVFTANNIKYSYYRTLNKLVVDEPNAPFKILFIFDDMGYVKIKRIGGLYEDPEFILLAPTVQKLWDKMYHKGILCQREYKKVIVPQYLNAQQAKSR